MNAPMNEPPAQSPLDSVLQEVAGSVRRCLPETPRVRLELWLESVDGGDGTRHLQPADGTRPGLHRLEMEWGTPNPGPGPVRPAIEPGAARPVSSLRTPAREAGDPAAADADADPATLNRRLELILGGPPGFNTGARAEILEDLLREFGRETLIAVLRKDWVSRFDTGVEASASVSRG